MSDEDDELDEDYEDELEDAWNAGEAVAKTRTRTLSSLSKAARKLFRAKPETQSLMLCVAQYWNDEADDAVHAYLVASTRPTPLWPHVCSENSWGAEAGDAIAGESCEYCDGDIGYLPFDDNGASILAFQSYCHENGSQEEPTSANYTPFAVARRAGSEVEVEQLGILYRPHDEMLDPEERTAAKAGAQPLDARARELFMLAGAAGRNDEPRRVLADYLLEQDDPRGEYISLALASDLDAEARARRDALLAEHRWSWIHPLEGAIPRDRAVFERGLLAAAEVFVDDDKLGPFENALAWASVERLHFLPGSVDFVSAVMTRALREVGPLATRGLAGLAKAKSWAIEKLHVDLATGQEIVNLVASQLPALRRLTIESDREEPPIRELAAAAWWKQLERVTWLASYDEVQWLSRLPEIEPVPSIAIALRGANGRPAGWEIALGRTAIEVSYVGWRAEATRGALLGVLAGLPQVPVVLVASPIWTPTADDITALAASGRTISIR